jgi:tRNA pseudouridine32 synthase/23S rRNA pseudouridine746 synthase
VRLKQALGLPKLSPVHRIDRETSGQVLFSVRSGDRSRYQTLFEQRQVHKTCEAVAPLSADPLPPSYQSRIVPDVQFFRQREAAGEPHSLTRILGVTPLPCINPPARGLYLLQPVTGKTHQLRVHLNAFGAAHRQRLVLSGRGARARPGCRLQPALTALRPQSGFCRPRNGAGTGIY